MFGVGLAGPVIPSEEVRLEVYYASPLASRCVFFSAAFQQKWANPGARGAQDGLEETQQPLCAGHGTRCKGGHGAPRRTGHRVE